MQKVRKLRRRQRICSERLDFRSVRTGKKVPLAEKALVKMFINILSVFYFFFFGRPGFLVARGNLFALLRVKLREAKTRGKSPRYAQ